MKPTQPLLGLFASLCVLCGQLSAAQKPNVLLICVDDLKPVLGCYGDKLVKSPNIDRLAARSVQFDRAFCNQAVCSPSRNSLLTGLRPQTLGIYDLATNFRRARPDAVTLPQFFKQHGWRTEGMGKVFHVGHGNTNDPASWSTPHWNANVVAYALPASKAKSGLTREEALFSNKSAKDLPRGAAYESADVSDNTYPDGALADHAIERLRAAKEKPAEPFFLAVGFVKPHLPFVAPKKYWDLYERSAFKLAELRTAPEGAPSYAPQSGGELRQYKDIPESGPMPDDLQRTLLHGYHAAVSYMDAQLGRVLAELDQLGLAQNTIIVLWGDHGWQLGDHGLWHKHTNFEIATRAPLLISVPGSKTVGRKCAAPVEFVDVYPTLAELCGLAIPSGLEGSSIKNFIDNPDTPSVDVAISQYPKKSPQGPVMGYSIRTERYRATYWRERNGSKIVDRELYDEQADPNETVSLAGKPEHQELLATLVKHLPPVGSDAPLAKSQSKGKKKEKPAPTKTAGNAADDRVARFNKLDQDKAGKLSREFYIAHQSDAAAAAGRFSKWDTNQDGFLSREEYVKQGK